MTSLLDVVNLLVGLFEPVLVSSWAGSRLVWLLGESRSRNLPVDAERIGPCPVECEVSGEKNNDRGRPRAFTHFHQWDSHCFWTDSISLLDTCEVRHIQGGRQLTDIYLLALAVENKGRLVTLDEGVSVHAVRGARAENLLLLPG